MLRVEVTLIIVVLNPDYICAFFYLFSVRYYGSLTDDFTHTSTSRWVSLFTISESQFSIHFNKLKPVVFYRCFISWKVVCLAAFLQSCANPILCFLLACLTLCCSVNIHRHWHPSTCQIAMLHFLSTRPIYVDLAVFHQSCANPMLRFLLMRLTLCGSVNIRRRWRPSMCVLLSLALDLMLISLTYRCYLHGMYRCWISFPGTDCGIFGEYFFCLTISRGIELFLENFLCHIDSTFEQFSKWVLSCRSEQFSE